MRDHNVTEQRSSFCGSTTRWNSATGFPVDIGRKVLAGEPIDVSMGYVNVIWQNDALNHVVQSLQLAASPPVPINITGPEVTSVRRIAERFGQLFGKEPVFTGEEAPSAWLSNASKSHRLFGKPSVTLDQMLQWIATWLVNDYDTYNKPTGFERRDGKFLIIADKPARYNRFFSYDLTDT
jgi:nucleoside-diphosphate-sugar epimerase